jgi:hypothetical protein
MGYTVSSVRYISCSGSDLAHLELSYILVISCNSVSHFRSESIFLKSMLSMSHSIFGARGSVSWLSHYAYKPKVTGTIPD